MEKYGSEKTPQQQREDRNRPLNGVVSWRVYDLRYRKFVSPPCSTRYEAEKWIVKQTRGKRDNATNVRRNALIPFGILADGTSPRLDAYLEYYEKQKTS